MSSKSTAGNKEKEIAPIFLEKELDESEKIREKYDLVKKDWSYIETYYPKIDKLALSIKKLSKLLEIEFKLKILDSKDYDNAPKIFNNKINDFLRKFFGKSRNLQAFGKFLLLTDKNAALELNKAIIFFGKNIDEPRIILGLVNRFTQINYKQDKKIKKIIKSLKINDSVSQFKIPPQWSFEKRGLKVHKRKFSIKKFVLGVFFLVGSVLLIKFIISAMMGFSYV